MATLDTDVVARLARVVSAGNEPYLYGRLICVLARAQPNEPEWLLAYLRLLTRLGLNAATAQVLGVLSGQMRQQAAVQALETAVHGGPSGLVPWSSRRRRFEANLAALDARSACAAAAVRIAWQAAADKFELHQSSDGRSHIRLAASVWPPGWLPEFDDAADVARRTVDVRRTSLLPPTLAFDGVAAGWELCEAYRQTSKVFLEASSTIYVVERRLEILALAMHLHDWRELIADTRVCWLVGPAALAELRELLTGDARWPLAERCFRLGLESPPDEPSPVQIMGQVGRDRASQIAALKREIDERYAGRDADWWAARFQRAADDVGAARGQPLRILGLTSVHTTFLQYSMRDCLKALADLGHRTQLVIEPDTHRPIDALTSLRAQLDFEPDLILLLSRLRSENTNVLHPAIPSVTWDQDALPWVFDPAARPELAWNDFLMGFAAATAPRRFGWPEHRCLYCPMAGSPDAYDAEALPDDELAPYRCDVSYVSHASAPPEQEMTAVAAWLPDERLRRIFRAAAVEKLLPAWMAGGEFPGPVMTAIFDAASELGERDIVWSDLAKLIPACQRIGDRAFRHIALGWVAEWAERTGRVLHIWGNGWDRHPRLARFARGPARNGHQLRCIYQATAINLQLMGFGFLHQRALDGLMAGAFFMARHSSHDAQAPLLKELIPLLDANGIRDAAGLHAADGATRARALALITGLAADPRGLCTDWIDIQRVALRDRHPAAIFRRFADITFTTPDEFVERVERFLAAPDERRQIASQMRDVLIEHYSYRARMAQMLCFIRGGFAQQAKSEPRPPRAWVRTPAASALAEAQRTPELSPAK